MNNISIKELKSKYGKLIENFLSLNVVQITNYVFPLITLPYITRIITPDKFGLVYFAIALNFYFCMFTDFGFYSSGVIDIAKNRDSQKRLSGIFSAIMIIKLILIAIAFIILCVLILSFERFKEDWLIYIFSFGVVIGNTFYPNWFFQGIEHMKLITLLNFISKFLSTMLIFVFLKQADDYMVIPILNSIGAIVATIIGIYIAIFKFKIQFHFPSWRELKYQFKYSFSFFIAQFSNSFATNSNSVFLGLITNNTIVGYYIAAEKIYQALFNLSGPINLVMTPYMVKNKNLEFYKKVFWLVLILALGILLFFLLFSKQIITIFYGISMLNAYKMLKIFGLLIFVIFLSMYIGLPLLGAYNHTKEVNLSTIIGSITHVLGLSLLFILHRFTPYSIIIMSILSTTIILLIRIFYIKKFKIFTKRKGT